MYIQTILQSCVVVLLCYQVGSGKEKVKGKPSQKEGDEEEETKEEETKEEETKEVETVGPSQEEYDRLQEGIICTCTYTVHVHTQYMYTCAYDIDHIMLCVDIYHSWPLQCHYSVPCCPFCDVHVLEKADL